MAARQNDRNLYVAQYTFLSDSGSGRTPIFVAGSLEHEHFGSTRVVKRNTLAASDSGKLTMADQQVINFYSVNDEYGEFSNFAAFPIKRQGKLWPTSEHYFQAQKFKDAGHQQEIRKAKTPMIAARLGRDRKKKLRQDWESVKDNIMREAVIAKFGQHEELRNVLLGTGEAKLIEHTTNDAYWGDGGDGSGRNMLGHILMEVRTKLRSELEVE